MLNKTIQPSKLENFRAFLQGRQNGNHFVILDPSTYAAEFAGKTGGYPTYQDNLNFHKQFKNDCPITAFVFPDEVIPELKWERTLLENKNDEIYHKETLQIPGGGKKVRIIAERTGTQPWIIKAPIQNEEDFELIDYYADCVMKNANLYSLRYAELFNKIKSEDFMPGIILLTAFEVYYLIDYPDMPLFYYDYKDRYLKSIEKVYNANIAVAKELMKIGCEIFHMGSAGLELLSPKIFDEAIIPFTRKTTDFIRNNGGFSSYHICGHSHQLLKSGRIDDMKPTWFETFSTPPCGNNPSLKESLKYLHKDIISKGNLPLELLRNGTVEEIKKATLEIRKQSRGRNHIIGQADATILSGTPVENIKAFIQYAKE